MSISGYFTPRTAELRMPRCEPGVPDANGVIFYGPVLTGQIDAASALVLSDRQAHYLNYSRNSGSRLDHAPVAAPLASRIQAATDREAVASHLEAHIPRNQAETAVSAPPRPPVVRPAARATAASAADRTLSRFAGRNSTSGR